jgi:hypothetical protein
MKRIAFCFLIYDIINHEELWHLFFKTIDVKKYTIYIHYKINVPLKYFEKYKLKNCIQTRYAHISLVEAQNLLLETAVNDGNDQFIFISNSCIPLKSFKYIYDYLNENYSYFNIAEHSSCFPRCNSVLQYIKKEHIQKASQWCILNKKHAKIIIDDKRYIRWFNTISTPDEHCYISLLYYNTLQNELITTPNIATGTTFINWEGMDYIYVSISGLKNYNSISDEELEYLLDSKSLFGRKFTRECELIKNTRYLNHITS